MITARPTEESDLDFVLAAESHPDNWPFVGQWSREQHQQAMASADCAHRILCDPADMRAVGYTIVRGLENPDRTVELMRLVITEKARGHGHAALRWAKRLAFEEHGAHRLWLDVIERNARARHLYAAEGFVEEGTLRECHATPDGGRDSLVLLGMLRREYEALAGGAGDGR